MNSGHELTNPFDFSNPVRDRRVLAGRDKELEEASYYLHQTESDSSYSLALIGDRAAGKTSLLNALYEEAQSHKLLVAQVRLDEKIAGSELDFFRELFEAIMDEGAKAELFGGVAGDEYSTFIEQVRLQELDPEGSQPLSFGQVYAKSIQEQRPIPLSRRSLKLDFERIIEEAQSKGFKGVVFLLDECDLLASSTSLLQSIRNILMDTPRLTFAMAGTEAMFPALQDVFSPVPRQFVRINVGNFSDWRDTEAAINRRLSHGSVDWAVPDPRLAREIHSVTQGNPYQVILVSHFAFRELDVENKSELCLTETALEGVASQLEQQTPDLARTVRKVRALSEEDALLLDAALELDGVSVEQFALAKTAFDREPSQIEITGESQRLANLLGGVLETGLVRIEEGVLRNHVASFERLYITYAVRSRVISQREDEESSGLDDPRYTLARKAQRRIADLLDGIWPSEDGILCELVPAGLREKDLFFLLNQEVDVSDYGTQVSIPMETGSEFVIVVWIPSEIRREEVETCVSVLIEEEQPKLRVFGVALGRVGAVTLDSDELVARRSKYEPPERSDEDMLIMEAMQGFYRKSPDTLKWVVAAADAIENRPELVAEIYEASNNVAFMAWGVGAIGTYERLVQIAYESGEDRSITRATEALFHAAQGRLDQACELLGLAERGLDPSTDRHVTMYEPFLLARNERSPRIEDATDESNLQGWIALYRSCFEALEAGDQMSERIAGIPGDRWKETAEKMRVIEETIS